ncbi:MAG: hypothetical protein ACYCWE_11655 [Eubacteriales bacterium]
MFNGDIGFTLKVDTEERELVVVFDGVEVFYDISKAQSVKSCKRRPVYPDLMKNLVPTRPNQAWSIDITYIRTKHGFGGI